MGSDPTVSDLAFRSAFRVSMLAVMEVISEVWEAMDSCFSTIWDAKSVVGLGRFLLPSVLSMGDNLVSITISATGTLISFSWMNSPSQPFTCCQPQFKEVKPQARPGN